MSKQGFQQLAALYRQILRVHRDKLPPPMKALGDSYVQEEFRRHLKAKTTPTQWKEFGTEWQSYLAMLRGEADIGDRSGLLTEEVVNLMTPEQQEQLGKLHEAAQDLGAAYDSLSKGNS